MIVTLATKNRKETKISTSTGKGLRTFVSNELNTNFTATLVGSVIPINGKKITRNNKPRRAVSIIADFNTII